jgi:phage terminase large subunit-like protein
MLSPIDKLELARKKLSGFDDWDAQEASLELLEKSRQETSFIRYWEPLKSCSGGKYQVEALEGFTPEKKIYIIRGGNRSGKTELGSFITCVWGLGKDYFKGERAWQYVKSLAIPEGRPRNIWIVGLDFNVLRDVIWREKLIGGKEHGAFIPKDASVTQIRHDDKQIFFSDGSVITCKSADSGREKFQSASVDLIWIDEECDAEIFDECYQRTVDCGGKIVVTVTPLTDISSGVKQPWIFDLYEDMQSGRKDIGFAALSVLDNPRVPEEEKTRLIQKWSGHVEERARLYGEFVRRSGLVYPMWDKKVHCVKPRAISTDGMHIVSIDPAATGITAALWARVELNGNITLYKEYYEADKVVSDHARGIKLRQGGFNAAPIDIWLIDPKWGQQRNNETHKTGAQLYRDAGIPVRLAEVGEDFGRNASLEYMQATVDADSPQPKIYVHADLANFISEIEHYTWARFERGELKGLSKDKPIKRNDHLMNAFQYLCAMRPRPRMRLQKQLSEDELRRKAQQNSYF